MEKIKIKRIKFNNGTPDFIISFEDWHSQGGYRAIIKDMCLCIRDILCVEVGNMSEKEYYTLPTWEG